MRTLNSHTIIFLSVIITADAFKLDDVLHSYVTLSTRDVIVQHRQKRSIHPSDVCDHEKIVDLEQLDRPMRLHLHCQRGIFTRDFEAVIVDSSNHEEAISIDKRHFYEGYVEGESATSKVNAYFENGNFMASIRIRNETYVIEPSWRHLTASNSYSMLAYKASDIKMDSSTHPQDHMGSSFCGYANPDEEVIADSRDDHKTTASDSSHTRKRRALDSSHDTCTLILVADYRFYQNIGNNETSTTVNYLIGSITRVDSLYRGIDFGNGNKNLGFEIQKIRIHKVPTPVNSGDTHYNMESTEWDTKDLLKAFSRNPDFSDFCLGHLYTYTSFSAGVLGLSWIASENVGDVGGICSPQSGGYYYNTAWSSMLNKFGRRILTQEADIVTAHGTEMGHSWGSQHDPDTTECSPSSSSGGPYIMYTYSVGGYDDNNYEFSPCSKRSITAVLDNKGKACFTARSESYCGNYRIEADEKCDAGAEGLEDEDPCCDKNCQLRDSAMCSDTNSDCCVDCQYAQASVLCRAAGGENITCDADTYCLGSSATCPESGSRPDGSTCINDGECSNGVCLSVCETNQMTSCVCDEVEDSCTLCCKGGNGTDAVCSTFMDLVLQDGVPCAQGYCEAGECIKQIQDLTDRLWDVIDNLSVDYIIQFMKNNLVLVIVVLSLIIYIPLCIIVACIDHYRDKDDKEKVEWHSTTNEELIRPDHPVRANIRETYVRALNPKHKSDMAVQSTVTSRPQVHASMGRIHMEPY